MIAGRVIASLFKDRAEYDLAGKPNGYVVGKSPARKLHDK
jgi:hypothetical protein